MESTSAAAPLVATATVAAAPAASGGPRPAQSTTIATAATSNNQPSHAVTATATTAAASAAQQPQVHQLHTLSEEDYWSFLVKRPLLAHSCQSKKQELAALSTRREQEDVSDEEKVELMHRINDGVGKVRQMLMIISSVDRRSMSEGRHPEDFEAAQGAISAKLANAAATGDTGLVDSIQSAIATVAQFRHAAVAAATAAAAAAAAAQSNAHGPAAPVSSAAAMPASAPAPAATQTQPASATVAVTQPETPNLNPTAAVSKRKGEKRKTPADRGTPLQQPHDEPGTATDHPPAFPSITSRPIANPGGAATEASAAAVVVTATTTTQRNQLNSNGTRQLLESRNAVSSALIDAVCSDFQGGQHLLKRRRIQDLVSAIDPLERVEPEVEELLCSIADEFIESVAGFACELAKHRGSDRLEACDLKLHLERNWNIRVPGFDATVGDDSSGAGGGGTTRSLRKVAVPKLHSDRVAAVTQARRVYGKSATASLANFNSPRLSSTAATAVAPGPISTLSRK